MFYNFPTAPRLADGSHVLAIDVFNNGCFSAVVRTADNKWHNLCLFDDKGDGGMTFVGLDSADLGSSAILLDDGYVAVIYDHHVSGGKVQIDAVRFDEQHTYTGRADNLKLFANNWYMLNKYGNNLLFNNMHELKQSNFNSAEVFNLGYALQPKKSASAGEWSLFTLKGTFVKSYDNVVDFVGDGNVLLAIGEKEMELRSFTGESLLKKPVACFEKFADGTFVLTTTDGLSRMYRPDGSPL